MEEFFEELSFWDAELSLKGQYAEFTRKRINPLQRKEEFPTAIFDRIIPLLEQRFGPARPFKCVEIGSGPVSNLAYGVDIGLLDVTAVDPLAEEYARLYEKYHLEDYPVKPVAGCGEILDRMFGEETFHCAYARNALDHTRDIQKTFRNLVYVTKTGGYVILQHAVREGSRNKWAELHHWDLDLVSTGLVAIDRKGRAIPLMAGCPVEFAIVTYQSVEHARWMDVVLKKVAGIPSYSISFHPLLRIRAVLSRGSGMER